MRLKSWLLFDSISFNIKDDKAQLYLHVNLENYAEHCEYLLRKGVTADTNKRTLKQPKHLVNSGIIRLDERKDIVIVLKEIWQFLEPEEQEALNELVRYLEAKGYSNISNRSGSSAHLAKGKTRKSNHHDGVSHSSSYSSIDSEAQAIGQDLTLMKSQLDRSLDRLAPVNSSAAAAAAASPPAVYSVYPSPPSLYTSQLGLDQPQSGHSNREISSLLVYIDDDADHLNIEDFPNATELQAYNASVKDLSVVLPEHLIAMIDAIKGRKFGVVRMLLGSVISADTRKTIDRIFEEIDETKKSKLFCEFELKVIEYQLEWLNAILMSPQSERQYIVYNELMQIACDVVELFIYEKIRSKVRPNFQDKDFSSDAFYEQWMRRLYTLDSLISFEYANTSSASLTDAVSTLTTRKQQIANGRLSQLSSQEKNALKKLGALPRDIEAQAFEKLIEIYLDDVEQLHPAYRYNTEDEKNVVRAKLLHARVPVNATDKDGNSLLHHALYHAVGHRYWLITALLCESGANRNIRNNAGQTPEEYAGIDKQAFDKVLQQSVKARIKLESELLRKLSQILQDYKPILIAAQERIRYSNQWFWSIFTSELVVRDRAERYGLYLKLLHQAYLTFDEDKIVEAIEQAEQVYCRMGSTSRLQDPLNSAVREYRRNPSAYGNGSKELQCAIVATLGIIAHDLTSIRKVMDERQAEVNNLRATVINAEREHKREIAEKTQAVETLQDQLTERKHENDRLKETIMDQKRSNAKLVGVVESLQKQIEQHNGQIASLEANLEAKIEAKFEAKFEAMVAQLMRERQSAAATASAEPARLNTSPTRRAGSLFY